MNSLTCGCITTLRGAVVDDEPTMAGPSGLARCKKVSPSSMAVIRAQESSLVTMLFV